MRIVQGLFLTVLLASGCTLYFNSGGDDSPHTHGGPGSGGPVDVDGGSWLPDAGISGSGSGGGSGGSGSGTYYPDAGGWNDDGGSYYPDAYPVYDGGGYGGSGSGSGTGSGGSGSGSGCGSGH